MCLNLKRFYAALLLLSLELACIDEENSGCRLEQDSIYLRIVLRSCLAQVLVPCSAVWLAFMGTGKHISSNRHPLPRLVFAPH